MLLWKIYIVYVCIFRYTYHISVLSKLRLDVCCRMSRIQTSIREACIAGQRRPKECRALLLYQSSAHISGHLTWMKSERWMKITQKKPETHKRFQKLIVFFGSLRVHSHWFYQKDEVQFVLALVTWNGQSWCRFSLCTCKCTTYFYTTSFSCMFHQHVSHLAGGCNRGFLAGLESPINFTHTQRPRPGFHEGCLQHERKHQHFEMLGKVKGNGIEQSLRVVGRSAHQSMRKSFWWFWCVLKILKCNFHNGLSNGWGISGLHLFFLTKKVIPLNMAFFSRSFRIMVDSIIFPW